MIRQRKIAIVTNKRRLVFYGHVRRVNLERSDTDPIFKKIENPTYGDLGDTQRLKKIECWRGIRCKETPILISVFRKKRGQHQKNKSSYAEFQKNREKLEIKNLRTQIGNAKKNTDILCKRGPSEQKIVIFNKIIVHYVLGIQILR